ncbi:hypothetical protein GOP47_0014104, partial [Adiantum capillus-veneris]
LFSPAGYPLLFSVINCVPSYDHLSQLLSRASKCYGCTCFAAGKRSLPFNEHITVRRTLSFVAVCISPLLLKTKSKGVGCHLLKEDFYAQAFKTLRAGCCCRVFTEKEGKPFALPPLS